MTLDSISTHHQTHMTTGTMSAMDWQVQTNMVTSPVTQHMDTFHVLGSQGAQIGADKPQMGQLWGFLRSLSVYFGSVKLGQIDTNCDKSGTFKNQF